MLLSYVTYLRDLEAYLQKLQSHALPSEVADSQANQVLILNLADYAKFTPYYPVTPEAAKELNRRAAAAQKAWQDLVPHE